MVRPGHAAAEVGWMETGRGAAEAAWKTFVRKHWKLVVAAVGGIAAAVVAALAVFLWVVANTQANGLVPTRLGDWSVGSIITFLLNLLLWELLLVASWVIAIGVAAFFVWYKKLPAEERRGMEGAPRRGRAAGGGGGVSFFVALVWLLIVWSDGRWNLALRNWTFNELVYSWIAACLVVLLVAGVPALLYLVWILRKR